MKLVESKMPIEGELMFDFSSAKNVWDFDESGNHKMSHCMKAVDFMIKWRDEIMADWQLASSGEKVFKIEPLK